MTPGRSTFLLQVYNYHMVSWRWCCHGLGLLWPRGWYPGDSVANVQQLIAAFWYVWFFCDLYQYWYDNQAIEHKNSCQPCLACLAILRSLWSVYDAWTVAQHAGAPLSELVSSSVQSASDTRSAWMWKDDELEDFVDSWLNEGPVWFWVLLVCYSYM